MKTQEQSSISQVKPKLEIPKTELVGVKKTKEITHESQKLPQPTGWRILILPFKMNQKTKGGVILGESTLEKQQVASQCGNVLAVGPHAYKDQERFPDGPWCKVGDWIMFARYAGSRIKI